MSIKIQRAIGSIYGFVKLSSKSYSLYGEDLVINHLFHNIGIKIGVYVDIGAFHPKWISNTYLLSKKGWKGIAVDLEPEKLKLFDYSRSNCKTICAAVVPRKNNDEIEYFAFNRLFSEWDTISYDEAEMRKNKSHFDYKKIKIPTITINEVLSEAILFANQDVDYLNIDVEGIDDEIITTIDFKKFKLKCLQFENNKFFKGSKNTQNILLNAGFVHYASMGGTHTYVASNLLKIEY